MAAPNAKVEVKNPIDLIPTFIFGRRLDDAIDCSVTQGHASRRCRACILSGGFLAFMHPLGYPKPLRYLNLLEWITSESSTSVVDSFFDPPTPVRVVCASPPVRMR